MKDTLIRYVCIAIACVVAYALLHVLRRFAIEPEVRGIWAGATGYMVSDLAQMVLKHRKKTRP